MSKINLQSTKYTWTLDCQILLLLILGFIFLIYKCKLSISSPVILNDYVFLNPMATKVIIIIEQEMVCTTKALRTTTA